MPSQENLPNLVINEVESSAVFEWMKNQEPSLINDHELYLVTDPEASAGIDEVPTENSKNLVYSGGVWAAIQQGGGADGKNSVLIEGGADATASQAIVDALPEDGRYVIEFTEESSEYQLLVPFVVAVGTSWTQDGDYYYQTINVPNMKASYNPICDCVLGSDMALNETYKEAWGKVVMIETFDESVKVWSKEATQVEYSIRMNVVGVNLASYVEGDEVAF